MNIAIIGGGGREHAIIKKIKENKSVEKIYALPGNAGMKADAICIDISPTDLENIKKFVIENKIDYCIVSPDDPLVLGLVDILQESGIECFGPEKKSAIIEGSKIFSKNLMKKYNIPTASYETFSDYESALKYLETMAMPVVIKADGLALGKGVTIAQDKEEAISAIKASMLDKKFGKSGENIVIEEFLTGVEVSVLTFTDGKTIVPMISSMDHKLSKDDDKGVNTGGMGTIAPNPCYTKEIAKQCMEKIFIPTINAMNSENRTFKGCLYFGLIITDDGVKVIEYNCRFGDPETQVVLPLLNSDLLTIMQAVTKGNLSDVDVGFSDNSACCVIMASDGYPEKYDKGFEINVPDEILDNVYFAGAIEKDGKLYTNSGRVLGVTGVDTTLKAAIEKSYDMLKQIDFENSYYRKDIGKKALKKEMEEK
ncbi:phosphoribosylamine--glycine ligase [[Eubacterium] yurii subsp. margaretiae ATCC 43715]|nr:phosphoribosylamine--glycine ligase [[Eubacterium] yurii subsp. margaretiae ATCC 43715]